MNNRQKEVLQVQLDAEKATLKELERQYREALQEIETRIRLLESDELTQSRIYRIEYQKALKKQVEAILEKLHADEYSTINQFISDSYTNGFVGTMYDLHGQDAPIIIPVDKNAAAKAVVLDTKLSKDLYTSLGVDINKMKKSVTGAITRGIASGATHDEIARNISFSTNAPLGRAKTIAQTESHRVQQASTYDSQKAAKAKGASIVKQWCSTLDGKTRSTHRKLDGQIREIDEPFEANGKKAMYPGDFGDPAEDCNCRCTSLQRAVKALDADELNTLKQRAEFFGLDKTESFAEFKNKYLKAAETLENTEKSDIISSGAVSGAYNNTNDPDGKKRDAHADLYYTELRNSSKDAFVSAVSKYAAVDEDTVSKTYKHIFEDKHNLENGYTYFDPDYYMAESFRRLRTNDNIQEHDIIMLRHEALEYDIMQANPDMSYEDAHAIAEKAYNYRKALFDWLKKEGK